MDNENDSEREDKQEHFWFGRNIAEIPCFKSSFTYGICSGLGLGLIYFLATSRTKRSTDVALGTFITVTAVRWMICRYNWSQEHMKQLQFKEFAKSRILKEGTEDDDTRNPKIDSA